jgi:hypothetical protein
LGAGRPAEIVNTRLWANSAQLGPGDERNLMSPRLWTNSARSWATGGNFERPCMDQFSSAGAGQRAGFWHLCPWCDSAGSWATESLNNCLWTNSVALGVGRRAAFFNPRMCTNQAGSWTAGGNYNTRTRTNSAQLPAMRRADFVEPPFGDQRSWSTGCNFERPLMEQLSLAWGWATGVAEFGIDCPWTRGHFITHEQY